MASSLSSSPSRLKLAFLEPFLSPSDMTPMVLHSFLAFWWEDIIMGIWLLEVSVAADLLTVSMPFCTEHNDKERIFLKFILIFSTKDFRNKFRTKDFNSTSWM